MASRRSVQNRQVHLVEVRLQDAGHKKSRIQSNRFAGLQINLHIVFCLDVVDAFHQFGDVVAFAGDMVSPAEVYPLHVIQVFAEFFLEDDQSGFQGIGILFAKRMEMQAVQDAYLAGVEIGFRRAQAGKWTGRIIQGMILRRQFRIDAQTDVDRAPAVFHQFRRTGSLA